MFWWQQLLVCTGTAALAVVTGIPVGYIIYKVWTRYDSRKSKPSISAIRSNKFDILVKESRNQYHEDQQIFTIPAKSKGQTLSSVFENKHSVIKQETTLQAHLCSEEIMKPVVWDKMGQEAVNQTRGEETLFVSKEGEFTKEKSQLMLEVETSTQKYQEAKAKMLMEIERLSRRETVQATGDAFKKADKEAENVRKPQELKTAGIIEEAPSLNEIEINLRIATRAWDGKPLPFQTKIWDDEMFEFDLVDIGHSDDLGQAYIDMKMANDIVWFYTEIGCASDDLEASYKKLCTKIAERLATEYNKRRAPCYV